MYGFSVQLKVVEISLIESITQSRYSLWD